MLLLLGVKEGEAIISIPSNLQFVLCTCGYHWSFQQRPKEAATSIFFLQFYPHKLAEGDWVKVIQQLLWQNRNSDQGIQDLGQTLYHTMLAFNLGVFLRWASISTFCWLYNLFCIPTNAREIFAFLSPEGWLITRDEQKWTGESQEIDLAGNPPFFYTLLWWLHHFLWSGSNSRCQVIWEKIAEIIWWQWENAAATFDFPLLFYRHSFEDQEEKSKSLIAS